MHELQDHRGPGPRHEDQDELRSVHEYETVTSTQDVAGRLLDEGRRPPFAVLAGQQSAGRGRLGRGFVSPPGASLALTVAVRTTLPWPDRTWIPLATGLAVLDTLPATTVELGLKWPNDIHTADGHKLGGILVEGHGPSDLLVGIGLNLRGPVRDADGTPVPDAAWLDGPGGIMAAGDETAGDEAVGDGTVGAQIAEVTAGGIGRRLARAVLAEIALLERWGGDAQRSGTRERYTMTCLTSGRAVRIEPLGGTPDAGTRPALHGTARDVDALGRLVLELPDGTRTALDVGDVRHLRRDGRADGGTGHAGPARERDHVEKEDAAR